MTLLNAVLRVFFRGRNTLMVLMIVLALQIFSSAALAQAVSPPTMFYYDKITLSGGFQSGNFPQIWNLTNSCPVTVQATVNLNGMKDIANAHA